LVLLLLAFNFIATPKTLAQRTRFSPYSSVGILGGGSVYYGDLAPFKSIRSPLNTFRWSATGHYTYQASPLLAARFSASWIRIGANDFTYATMFGNSLAKAAKDFPLQYTRNYHFRNDIKEFAVSGVLNIIAEDIRSSNRRNPVAPYFIAGLGLIMHNPKAVGDVNFGTGAAPDYQWIALRNLNTEGRYIDNDPSKGPKFYSLVQLVAPIGAGINMKLNDRWDFTAEGILRIPLSKDSDYLDDISTLLTPSSLSGSGVVPSLINRGLDLKDYRTGADRDPTLNDINYRMESPERINSRKWDTYITGQVGLRYYLQKQVKCPVVR
jgi:hypothetical protein